MREKLLVERSNFKPSVSASAAAKKSLALKCFTADTKQGDYDDQSEGEPRSNLAAWRPMDGWVVGGEQSDEDRFVIYSQGAPRQPREGPGKVSRGPSASKRVASSDPGQNKRSTFHAEKNTLDKPRTASASRRLQLHPKKRYQCDRFQSRTTRDCICFQDLCSECLISAGPHSIGPVMALRLCTSMTWGLRGGNGKHVQAEYSQCQPAQSCERGRIVIKRMPNPMTASGIVMTSRTLLPVIATRQLQSRRSGATALTSNKRSTASDPTTGPHRTFELSPLTAAKINKPQKNWSRPMSATRR